VTQRTAGNAGVVVMSGRRRACTFRQIAVTRALKGVIKAGIQVARVEIGENGTITLTLGKPESQVEVSELDNWIKQHADQVKGH